MDQCIHCGGSRLTGYDPHCEHQTVWDLVPEPESVALVHIGHLAWVMGGVVQKVLRGEDVWEAHGSRNGAELIVRHPTREGCLALWRERYATGLLLEALFTKLSEWAHEGEARRAIKALEDEICRAVLGADAPNVEPDTLLVPDDVAEEHPALFGDEGEVTHLAPERPKLPNWLSEADARACVAIVAPEMLWEARFLGAGPVRCWGDSKGVIVSSQYGSAMLLRKDWQ